MADISHMDWAQQIKMDHDLNIRKDTLKVKKIETTEHSNIWTP